MSSTDTGARKHSCDCVILPLSGVGGGVVVVVVVVVVVLMLIGVPSEKRMLAGNCSMFMIRIESNFAGLFSQQFSKQQIYCVVCSS